MFSYCSLASGSSGNVNLIQSNNTKILVDVGKSRKYIVDSLSTIGIDIADIDAVFITHEHKDHSAGLRVLSKKSNFKIYINYKSYKVIESELDCIDKSRFVFIDNGNEYLVKDLIVKPFRVDHDAANCHGFTIGFEGKKISIASDIGNIDDAFISMFYDSDLISIEANHDERLVAIGKYSYHLKRRILGDGGHISNITAGNMLSQVCRHNKKLKQIVLTHLSRENNYPELAKQTVESILNSNGIRKDVDVKVDVALRDKISSIYILWSNVGNHIFLIIIISVILK